MKQWSHHSLLSSRASKTDSYLFKVLSNRVTLFNWVQNNRLNRVLYHNHILLVGSDPPFTIEVIWLLQKSIIPLLFLPCNNVISCSSFWFLWLNRLWCGDDLVILTTCESQRNPFLSFTVVVTLECRNILDASHQVVPSCKPQEVRSIITIACINPTLVKIKTYNCLCN
jgi:hypothetical protein